MPLECDLLVIGTGAGGLSAAVVAGTLGLKVLLVDKEAQFGGTTAWSGGWMWIPGNPLARAAGIHENPDAPLAYLRRELGAQFDEQRARAFLKHGPRMVEFFRNRTALQFVDGNTIPDFHGRTQDAATGGRSVCAAPFNARHLGGLFALLKPPLEETTLWGMAIASGAELRHFLNATRSPRSFVYAAWRLLGHAWDRLRHGRGQRLVNGNALVAALAASAARAGVDMRLSCPARSLTLHQGRVTGATLGSPEGDITVLARRGVVLACGGFPHDAVRLRELLPHAATRQEARTADRSDPRAHWSAASRGNTGDGLRMGEAAGAVVARDLACAAALAPVSLVPRADGTVAHFPHLIERGKPGLIAVTAAGRRFVNEADSYHDFMQGLLAATPPRLVVQAWLVCDHRFIRRYGLGAVKPAPLPLSAWLRNGYLRRSGTLAGLARVCGIDASVLAATVDGYNSQADAGRDDEFAKGETPYNRMQGDAGRARPNPCMAPLRRAPYYAVRVVPGSLGTFAGLRSNAQAQVLDTYGDPIPGLYAGGNDMASVMGGHYPSGGITLGPAMTFGLIAAHHAAGIPAD